MTFDGFLNSIPKITNLPLPGWQAHLQMTPSIREKALKALPLNKRQPKASAVLALFYPKKPEETHLLLILRKSYPGVHSNQIAFPGGKMEKTDHTLKDTALRETHEEIGVPPDHIKIIRALSEVYIPPSNFMVSPFIGYSENPPAFKIQTSEVEKIISVGLPELLDDRNVFLPRITTSYATNLAVPAFRFYGHTVWGATAMMLNEIKQLLKS